jgi:translation initiation factor 3 subunit J
VKQKIAEKEAAKAARVGDDDVEYDEDYVLDPRNKARFDREREIRADLDNAAALFGAAGLGGGF